jgi:aspartyl aminopeptidase
MDLMTIATAPSTTISIPQMHQTAPTQVHAQANKNHAFLGLGPVHQPSKKTKYATESITIAMAKSTTFHQTNA